jgi:site-specific DNA-methyltransferase (adenine-specific)
MVSKEKWLREKIHGDCFDHMPLIPNKSVDLIFADLPYGTTKCKWDSILPLDKLWEQYNRIIKDRGCILLFAQTPFDKVLGCSNLKMLKYEWIWEKTHATGFYNAKKMPMKAHENILVFYKNKPTYNPQKTEGHDPTNSYTKKTEVFNKTEVYGKVTQDVSGGGETDRYPRSVQIFSSDKQKNKLDGTIHSTQKPLALIEYFVKTYSNEGDLVLDNVAGSGTLAVACENLNRQYIVIEKEKESFDKILKRTEKYA